MYQTTQMNSYPYPQQSAYHSVQRPAHIQPPQYAQPILSRPHSDPVYKLPHPQHTAHAQTVPPHSYTNNQGHKLPHLCARSHSQPSLPNLPCPAPHSQSGIVLQSLPHSQQQQQQAMMNSASMQMNLAQFSKYSQYQLQAALSVYPPWLQKEYVRRLQRQYEEMYVVEDPKILHSSSICPRDGNTNHHNNGHSHIECDILSESENEYLSESALLSPSPYAYSVHANDENSNNQQTNNQNFTFDETTNSEKKLISNTDRNGINHENKSMLTCFQILDDIKDDIIQINTQQNQKNDSAQSQQQQSEYSEAQMTAERAAAYKKQQQQQQQVALQQYYQQRQQQIMLQQQQQQMLVQQQQYLRAQHNVQHHAHAHAQNFVNNNFR